MISQFDQKFSDDWEVQFEEWKQKNKHREDQDSVEKCLYVSRAGLMECLLPEERVRICRDIENYIKKMNLMKTRRLKHPCISCEEKFETVIGLSKHMDLAHPQILQDFDPMADVNSNVNELITGNIQGGKASKAFSYYCYFTALGSLLGKIS